MFQLGIIIKKTSEILNIFTYNEKNASNESRIINICQTEETRGLILGDVVKIDKQGNLEKVYLEKYQVIAADQDSVKFRMIDTQVGIKQLPEDDIYIDRVFGRVDNSKKLLNFGWYDMVEVKFISNENNNTYWCITSALRNGKCRKDCSQEDGVQSITDRFAQFPFLLQEEAKKNGEKEDAIYKKLGPFRLTYIDKSDPLKGNMPTLEPVVLTTFGLDSISEGCTVALRDVDGPDDLDVYDLPMGIVFKKKNKISIQLSGDSRNQKFVVGQTFRLESIQIENNIGYWMINEHVNNELLLESINLGEKVNNYDDEFIVKNEKALENAKSFMEKDAILNDDQIQAVLHGLDRTKKIVLIQGPPGTGKTRTLAELICQYIADRTQIFVVTPTKFAKNNIMRAVEKRCLERLSGVFDEITTLMDQDKFYELIKFHPAYRKLSYLAKSKDKKVHGTPEFEQIEKEINFIRKRIFREFHENCRVVFSTITSCYLNLSTRNTGFNPKIMIVDEASQLSESVLWPKTVDIDKIVLAGDPQQLPAVVISEKARHHNMGESLMERLYKENKNNINVCLSTQYRMNNKIMHWSSMAFYDSKLIAHESVENQRIMDLAGLPLNIADRMKTDARFDPLIICDTGSERDVNIYPTYYEKLNDGSFLNEGEAELLVLHLQTLIEHCVPVESIAVITPYSGQKILLEKMIREKYGDLIVIVDTIDAMQGEEKEVILFSLVRNNPLNSCGFLTDVRRLNVAVTRAKRQFFMVGNLWMLATSREEQLKKLYETFVNQGRRISPQIVRDMPDAYPTRVVNMFGRKHSTFMKHCTDRTMKKILQSQLDRREAKMLRTNPWGTVRKY